MRDQLKFFIFCLLFVVLSIGFVYADSTSLEDILEFPDSYDGKEVQIEGEVIGEPLNGNLGVWVNVSAKQQIGVFLADKEKIKEITYWGDYRTTGDQVRVKGIFYKDCPEHQISDVHCKSLEVVGKGHKNKYIISSQKKQLAKILSIIFLIIGLIYLIRLKYGKQD
ncbi:MAG: hypothetical protein P9M02_03770 [Candidatus Susulua stagnicola]|nr:hypothetical protein [Candidatus Susulua stagnicola]